MNIIIVEDDPIIRRELKILLENALYKSEALEQFDCVAETIQQQKPELVLLDLNLPGVSGFDICTQVREKSDVPIIFLTSRTDSMDELTGILKGGDDYITKPYQAPILLARIAAILKRTTKEQGELDYPDVKGVRLNPMRVCVEYKGKSVELTKSEWKIMNYLFQHSGEMIPRLDIVEYLWDNQVFIDDNALSVNIGRIREKLKGIGVENLIETKRGMGYRI